MFTIDVFTDGGYIIQKDKGGWAYIIIINNNIMLKETSNVINNSTNNRMELLGVIKALERVIMEFGYNNNITIYSDSNYVVNGFLTWGDVWRQNNWMKDGSPIKNKDLWEELFNLKDQLYVSLVWVKGHAGHKYNEECDSMIKNILK